MVLGFGILDQALAHEASFCAGGVRPLQSQSLAGRGVCCAALCRPGACGGPGCANRPGGQGLNTAAQCCVGAILKVDDEERERFAVTCLKHIRLKMNIIHPWLQALPRGLLLRIYSPRNHLSLSFTRAFLFKIFFLFSSLAIASFSERDAVLLPRTRPAWCLRRTCLLATRTAPPKPTATSAAEGTTTRGTSDS